MSDNKFDFKTSMIPQFTPLKKSFTQNAFEKEIKELFINLFNAYLGEDTFNTLVLGSPHLGSYKLVQKTLNADGLSVLQSSAEEYATRYLYRAWKSGDVQKRGLHLLRVYVKLLFGSMAKIEQLQHSIHDPYPTKLIEFDRSRGLLPDHYLTSRIYVDIDASLSDESIKRIANSVQSVLPARFVPELRFVTFSSKARFALYSANNAGAHVHFISHGELQ